MATEYRGDFAVWGEVEALAQELEQDSYKYGGYCQDIFEGKMYCSEDVWQQITKTCQEYLQLQRRFTDYRAQHAAFPLNVFTEFTRNKQQLVASLNQLFKKLIQKETASNAESVLVSPHAEALAVDYTKLLCENWNATMRAISKDDKSVRVKNLESIYKTVYLQQLIDVLNRELERLSTKFVNRFLFTEYVERRLAILRDYFDLIEREGQPARIVRFKEASLTTDSHPIFIGAEVLERLADELDQEKTEASIFPGRKASVLATSFRKVSLTFKSSLMLFMLDHLEALKLKQQALKKQCEILEGQVAVSQKTQAEISGQVEHLQRELRQAQGIIDALRKIHVSLTEQKKEAAKAFNQERLALSRQNASSQEDLRRATLLLEEKQQELQQAQTRIQQLETDLHEANDRVIECAERFAKISNRLIVDIRQGGCEMRQKLNRLLQENWYIRTVIGQENENLTQALETQYQITDSLCEDVSAEKIDEHLEKIRALRAILEFLRNEFNRCANKVTQAKEQCSTLADDKLQHVMLAIEEGLQKSILLEQQLQDLKLNAFERGQVENQSLEEMGALINNFDQQQTSLSNQARAIKAKVIVLGEQLQGIEETVKIVKRQAASLSDQVSICLEVVRGGILQITKRLIEEVGTEDAIKKANAINQAFAGLQVSLKKGGSQCMDGVILAAGTKRGFGSLFGFFTGKSTSLKMLEDAVKNHKQLQDELKAKGVSEPALDRIQVFSSIRAA